MWTYTVVAEFSSVISFALTSLRLCRLLLGLWCLRMDKGCKVLRECAGKDNWYNERASNALWQPSAFYKMLLSVFLLIPEFCIAVETPRLRVLTWVARVLEDGKVLSVVFLFALTLESSWFLLSALGLGSSWFLRSILGLGYPRFPWRGSFSRFLVHLRYWVPS